nr:MAG TPA: head tail connector [Caudoviricetes sp.]
MPELDEIKKYLRIDFDDDDSYITLLVETAKEYIEAAVGAYREGSARHRLLLYNIVATLYENRQFTLEKGDQVAYTLKSMILQLELEESKE